MAQNQTSEEPKTSQGASSAPRKVGMYDRPASASRQPLTLIIAIVVLLALFSSLAFFYFF